MRDKNRTEIFDNLSQAWSHNFNDDGAVIADECPMSEKAILYAMGELGADEIHKITGHFHNCRFCLDLVLDLRLAEDESRQSSAQLVDILPALADAIQKSNDEKLSVALPEKLISSFSNFWSYLFRPKIIVPLASACLAFIIIHSGLNDSDTSQSYRVIQKRIETPKQEISQPSMPQPDTFEKTAPTKDVSSQAQNKSEQKETIYEVTPVHKYEQVSPPIKKKRKKRIPQSALQNIDLIQFKLVGIVFSPKGNTAMLEDSTGKGYIVKEGTYIGKNSGKIVQIKKDMIIIEEQIENSSGEIILHKVELKLHNKG